MEKPRRAYGQQKDSQGPTDRQDGGQAITSKTPVSGIGEKWHRNENNGAKLREAKDRFRIRAPQKKDMTFHSRELNYITTFGTSRYHLVNTKSILFNRYHSSTRISARRIVEQK